MTELKLKELTKKVVKLRECILHFSQKKFSMCYYDYSSNNGTKENH